MIIEPFESFKKIPRLNRECIVTEKIDGTNVVVYVRAECDSGHDPQPRHLYKYAEIVDKHGVPQIDMKNSCCALPMLSERETWTVHAGSKNRWISIEEDHYGFAKWVQMHTEELKGLGPGKHHGEWFGPGIQNRMGYESIMKERAFALFNTKKWAPIGPNAPPICCTVVPTIYRGPFDTNLINWLREWLKINGSFAVPGAMAEGIVVYHIAADQYFKATCNKDEDWKGGAQMSYDIYLVVDLGGPHPIAVGDWNWNYTSNCVPMWREAGADLADFDGKTAGECLAVLEKSIEEMKTNPSKYIAMNPQNGWGSYDTLLPALEELRQQFALAPKAIVRVSR